MLTEIEKLATLRNQLQATDECIAALLEGSRLSEIVSQTGVSRDVKKFSTITLEELTVHKEMLSQKIMQIELGMKPQTLKDRFRNDCFCPTVWRRTNG